MDETCVLFNLFLKESIDVQSNSKVLDRRKLLGYSRNGNLSSKTMINLSTKKSPILMPIVLVFLKKWAILNGYPTGFMSERKIPDVSLILDLFRYKCL